MTACADAEELMQLWTKAHFSSQCQVCSQRRRSKLRSRGRTRALLPVQSRVKESVVKQPVVKEPVEMASVVKEPVEMASVVKELAVMASVVIPEAQASAGCNNLGLSSGDAVDD
ncbi:hypothetical protein DYB31_016116 [Aphanomyces astaci]|uniref:Uncharacterized protein n=1 Tax=Aphanomyces astaci TaxID=112090 RepID=A0A397EQQ4_APHAT|nr:hypothetical protein DYB31_016116 [Aphanomyces astaci]